MKKKLFILAGIAATVSVIVSCSSTQNEKVAVAEISNDSLVKRGAYLVNLMGCNDCHTPKKMTPHGPALDMDRLLSGHPAEYPVLPFDTATAKNWVLFNMVGTGTVGPWGASFAANLTSDETGIGTWTEEQFKKALKEGKFKGLDGSRPLLPPMPWENYKDMNEEDMKAIFAFLKSTKPVKNIVPQAIAPQDLGSVTRS
ncbi:MAG: diheme cytochrome c-553 [Sphingobacteriales bacterium]|nr:MAG: diheme cytochrome c-553 [Sphingobacteriales bacterium]